MTSTTEGRQATVAAVVLAAGEGSRFDSVDHKLVTMFRQRPLASWAIEAALEAGFGTVYVVTGAVDLSELIETTHANWLQGRPGGGGDIDRPTPELVVLHNPDWADGQATSLALAVDTARSDGHGAVVVGLADQPLVPASAWRSVGAASGPIVAATFDGERRPPVKLDRGVWPDLPRTGDDGARVLLARRPELVSELPCMGSAFDIDTLEDLERWN